MIAASHSTGVLQALAGWAELVGVLTAVTVAIFLLSKRRLQDPPRGARRSWRRSHATPPAARMADERSNANR
jgi:hypothetical protein